MSAAQPTLVFDGDCGFCTMVVNLVRSWVRPNAAIVDWQRTDLESLGVTEDECIQAIQWVEPDGSHLSGGRAAAATLKAAPQPWPIVGTVMDLPGISRGIDVAYKLIAANRYRLPGSTPACKIPLQQVA